MRRRGKKEERLELETFEGNVSFGLSSSSLSSSLPLASSAARLLEAT